MQNIAVQEHVGEERGPSGTANRVEDPCAVPPKILTWNSSTGTSAKLAAAAGPVPVFCQRNTSGVGGDEPDRDPLEANRAQGVVVGKRDEDHGVLTSTLSFRGQTSR